MQRAIERKVRGHSTLRVWSLHLLSFSIPVATLAFWWSAPHGAPLGVAWLLVIAGAIGFDRCAADEVRQPTRAMPAWPFRSVLYVLFALQVTNVAVASERVAEAGFFHLDTLSGGIFLGVTSAYSGIVLAHEWMHRPSAHQRFLARVLMALVLYEHFYTEHLRGHHVNVGLANDPATARFGERYWSFLARTIPAQLRHAWRLERERLQSAALPPAWRWLNNRIVQGWIGEACIVLAILATCGSGALVLFVAQAALAVCLLEATNFYEHWGLERTSRRPTTADAWDTNSWFTLYGLVGLSRHADHHVSSHRPYEQLRYWPESPKLPYGYLRMDVLAMFQNRKFQCLMSEELRRRRLGPFAASGDPPERAKRAE